MNYLCVCVCVSARHTLAHTLALRLFPNTWLLFSFAFFSSFFFHTGQLLFRGEGKEGKGAAELHEKEKKGEKQAICFGGGGRSKRNAESVIT